MDTCASIIWMSQCDHNLTSTLALLVLPVDVEQVQHRTVTSFYYASAMVWSDLFTVVNPTTLAKLQEAHKLSFKALSPRSGNLHRYIDKSWSLPFLESVYPFDGR